MKKSVLLTAIAATMGLMGVAQAHNHDKSCDHHQGASFDHVSVAYGQSDVTGEDMDLMSLEAQKHVWDKVFVEAEFAKYDFDSGFEADTYSVGVGYAHPVNKKTSVYGSAGFMKVDSDALLAGADDDGWYAAVGLKHMLFKKVEVDTRLTHTDVLDVTDKDVTMTAKYYVHKDWTVNAGYTFDAKETFVGVSYHF